METLPRSSAIQFAFSAVEPFKTNKYVSATGSDCSNEPVDGPQGKDKALRDGQARNTNNARKVCSKGIASLQRDALVLMMRRIAVPTALVTMLWWQFAQAAVSDERVRMWVVSALEGSPAVTDADARNKLTFPRTAAQSLSAWRKLKECRDAGMSLELDLASAEHYLFIRAFAASKGERDIERLPALYGNVKDKFGPAAQLLKTSDQPVSPPDADVVAWGNRGVAAGLADYKKATGNDPKSETGKVQQYKLALEGYYANYIQTTPNPSCRIQP